MCELHVGVMMVQLAEATLKRPAWHRLVHLGWK